MVRMLVCGTGDGSSILLLAPKELVAQLVETWVGGSSPPQFPKNHSGLSGSPPLRMSL